MPILPRADVVLRGGRVFVAYGEPVAEAIALWSGKVLAVGSSADMEPLIGPGTRIVELRGRLATPGLFEAHAHLLPMGISMAEIDARPQKADTLDALLGLIREAAAKKKPGEWILARGYDDSKLDIAYYVHRNQEETDALHYLSRRMPTLVWGARGIGKSTFINYIKSQLGQNIPAFAGSTIIELDCTRYVRKEGTANEFFFWMVSAVLSALNVQDIPSRIGKLLKNSEFDPIREVSKCIESVLKIEGKQGLVLVLTSIEKLYGDHPEHLPEQLWSLVKHWGSMHQPPWNQLLMLLEVSSAPLLMQDRDVLPRNGAVQISLEDFTRAQVERLAEHYDLNLTDLTHASIEDCCDGRATLCDRLIDLVGGHPALLQLAFYSAASNRRDLDDVLDEVLENLERSIYSQVLQKLDWALSADPRLRAVLNALLRGQSGLSDRERVRLEIASIIQIRKDQWCIRYGLYQRYLRKRSA